MPAPKPFLANRGLRSEGLGWGQKTLWEISPQGFFGGRWPRVAGCDGRPAPTGASRRETLRKIAVGFRAAKARMRAGGKEAGRGRAKGQPESAAPVGQARDQAAA